MTGLRTLKDLKQDKYDMDLGKCISVYRLKQEAIKHAKLFYNSGKRGSLEVFNFIADFFNLTEADLK